MSVFKDIKKRLHEIDRDLALGDAWEAFTPKQQATLSNKMNEMSHKYSKRINEEHAGITDPERTKKDLTPRQQEMLDFIRKYIHENGVGPLLREIGDHLNIGSPNAVRGHLLALDIKGRIILHEHISRGIELVDSPESE